MLELVRIEDAPALRAMFDRYSEELRVYWAEASGDDAPYPYFDAYWTEPGRHPFFVVEQGKRMGFVLIRGPESTTDGTHQVAEFFVEPDHRNTGVGSRAFTAVLRRLPGSWTLQAYRSNRSAVAFWASCLQAEGVREVTSTEIRDGGDAMMCWSFLV